MQLGPGASIQAIIEKLDSIYGSVHVDEREDILAEFYTTHQKVDEECARWSCRLEDIISKAQQKRLVHWVVKSIATNMADVITISPASIFIFDNLTWGVIFGVWKGWGMN